MNSAHRNRTSNPSDEDTNAKAPSDKRKGQHEPPARYTTFGVISTRRCPSDDFEARGITRLDSMADDDDSVVLSNEDRYDTEVPRRDPVPARKGVRRRKKMEPEASFEREKSFQTIDNMTASTAETETGGCVNFFDSFFLCVNKEEELRKAQSKESQNSDYTDNTRSP